MVRRGDNFYIEVHTSSRTGPFSSVIRAGVVSVTVCEVIMCCNGVWWDVDSVYMQCEWEKHTHMIPYSLGQQYSLGHLKCSRAGALRTGNMILDMCTAVLIQPDRPHRERSLMTRRGERKKERGIDKKRERGKPRESPACTVPEPVRNGRTG